MGKKWKRSRKLEGNVRSSADYESIVNIINGFSLPDDPPPEPDRIQEVAALTQEPD
jgi:hypothetical protein